MVQGNIFRDGFTTFGGNGESLVMAPRGKVRLYFIAFKLVNEQGFLKVPLNIKGRQYNMPQLGGYIEVDSVVAKDIQERLQVYDPKLGFVAGVTTEPHTARAIKAAFDSGKLSELSDMATIMRAGVLGELSTDALKEELERRDRLNGIVKEVAADNAVIEEVVTTPTTVVGASKSKKTA